MMKKLFSLAIATFIAASSIFSAFAADREIGSHDSSPYTDGSYSEITEHVRTKSDLYTIYGFSFRNEARKVLDLVNAERRAEGLPPLVWEAKLVRPAETRAVEQVLSQSHTRPNGDAPSTVSDLVKGENVAGGATSAEEVVDGWMNSPGHRANILEPRFTGMAVACMEVDGSDYGVYWAQLFSAGEAVEDAAEKPASADASEKKFELEKLKSNVKAMTDEYKEKEVYNSRLIAVSNQIIRLNNEISSGKKPPEDNDAEIKSALKSLDSLLVKTDLSKMSAYTKPGTAKKTGRDAIAETEERLSKMRKSLDKAMKAYSVKSATDAQ